MTEAKTRCIECGGFVGSLNEDEDGTPCAACAERLLETLPGVFHQPWAKAPLEEGAGEPQEEPQFEYGESRYADDGAAGADSSEPVDRGRFGQ